SSRSPTHTIGVTPASSADRVRVSTVSSVSQKYCRRSLCPMIAWVAPTAVNMGPEISPVNAPSLAHAMFCAPTRMFEPLAASTAAARLVNGGQITISQCPLAATIGRNFSKNAVVSAGVLYIFQLPAIAQAGPQPQIDTPPRLGPMHQDRHVLPAVVGRGCRGVAAMVGGKDRKIFRPHRAFKIRHPRVELFQRRAIAFNIVMMPILL